MIDINVRPSNETDIPAIHKIYEYEVLNGTGTFEKVPPSVEDLSLKRLNILELGFPHLVAEVDGEVIAYSYVSVYRERSAYSNTVENAIYVSPEQRNSGVGILLVKALIKKCEKTDLKQMIAVIGDSENHGSIKLHSKLGFRKIGVLEKVGFKFGRWIDVVLMQKAL